MWCSSEWDKGRVNMSDEVHGQMPVLYALMTLHAGIPKTRKKNCTQLWVGRDRDQTELL